KLNDSLTEPRPREVIAQVSTAMAETMAKAAGVVRSALGARRNVKSSPTVLPSSTALSCCSWTVASSASIDGAAQSLGTLENSVHLAGPQSLKMKPCSSSWTPPITPNTGRRDSQLNASTMKKIVATTGKNRRARLSPATPAQRLQ